jgi:hypothetical protein
MPIGPPPEPIVKEDGKEWYPGPAMRKHLMALRAELARVEYDRDRWKLQALGPQKQ